MNIKNPINWKLINEQVQIALSSCNKIMLYVKISADFGFKKSLFFESNKKQEIVQTVIPYPKTGLRIEEICLQAINSEKEILKTYTNAKVLDIMEIHEMGEKGYSKGVIYSFNK